MLAWRQLRYAFALGVILTASSEPPAVSSYCSGPGTLSNGGLGPSSRRKRSSPMRSLNSIFAVAALVVLVACQGVTRP